MSTLSTLRSLLRTRARRASRNGARRRAYRNYSAGAHPSYEGRGPYGLAIVIYSLALWVAASSLGFPDTDNIESASQRYPT